MEVASVYFDPEDAVDEEIDPTDARNVHLGCHGETGLYQEVPGCGLENGLRVRVDELDDGAKGACPRSICVRP